MEYSTTLPEQYKTWTELYLAAKHLESGNADEFYTQLRLCANSTDVAILTESPPGYVKFKFAFVKQQAFEELLNDRNNYLKPNEFMWIRQAINWASTDYERNLVLTDKLEKLTNFKNK